LHEHVSEERVGDAQALRRIWLPCIAVERQIERSECSSGQESRAGVENGHSHEDEDDVTEPVHADARLARGLVASNSAFKPSFINDLQLAPALQ
jgi:hypothetical protein